MEETYKPDFKIIHLGHTGNVNLYTLEKYWDNLTLHRI